MTQVINFDQLRRKSTAADIIFIRAVMAASDGDVACVKGSDGDYELEFKIGGKEVDFLKFCEAFERCHDAAMRSAAEERLNELKSFTKMRDALETLEQTFAAKVNAIIEEYHNAQEGAE